MFVYPILVDELFKLKNNLKNHILENEIRTKIKNDILVDNFNQVINFLYIESKNGKLDRKDIDFIVEKIKILNSWLVNPNLIEVNKIDIVNEMNYFLDHFYDLFEVSNRISKDEFSNRYDMLIELLNTTDYESNLSLYTKENKEFKLYKYKDSLVIRPHSDKNYLSTSKENLIKIAYNEKDSNLISYTPPIIQKIFDNTIFEYVINTEKHFDKKIEKLESEGNSEKAKEVESEKEQYVEEKEKIQSAIKRLEVSAYVIDEERREAQNLMKSFNSSATKSLWMVFFFFVIYFFALLSIVFGSNSFDKMGYFMLVFPIVFSSTLAFLFYRQANIKKKIVHQVDRRIILIHEVRQSLLALLEIHQGKDMEEHTMKIIDKLIENILKNDIYDDKCIQNSENFGIKSFIEIVKNNQGTS